MITGIVVGVLALAAGLAGLGRRRRARRAAEALGKAADVVSKAGPPIEDAARRRR